MPQEGANQCDRNPQLSGFRCKKYDHFNHHSDLHHSQDHYKSMLSQAEVLRDQYKTKLSEEIEKINNPAPASTPVRPSSGNSSVLSYEAVEFVPSSSSSSLLGYCTPHYSQYYGYSNSDSLHFNHYYDNTAEQSESTAGDTKIWGNMLNILKN